MTLNKDARSFATFTNAERKLRVGLDRFGLKPGDHDLKCAIAKTWNGRFVPIVETGLGQFWLALAAQGISVTNQSIASVLHADGSILKIERIAQ
jgi:hypothetical protein